MKKRGCHPVRLLVNTWLTIYSLVSFAETNSQANVEHPIAKSPSTKTGTFVMSLEGEPTSIDPLVSTEKSAETVIQFMCDSLLRRDLNSYEWNPALAAKFDISKDKKTFLFTLRPDLTFHDGKTMSSEDVKFTLEKLQERSRKLSLPQLEEIFSNLHKIQIIDPKTVSVSFSNVSFKNLEVIATLPIVSKNYYQSRKIASFSEPPGRCAGPYRPINFTKNHKIYLEAFPYWYGANDPKYSNQYNFSNIVFKFPSNDKDLLKELKKGEIDFIAADNQNSILSRMGDFKKFPKMELVKAESKVNHSYDFIGWNLKSSLFRERETRLALAYLMNRSELHKKPSKKFLQLAAGPISIQNDYAPVGLAPLDYNKEMALQNLKKSGWTELSKEGLLQKRIGNEKIDFRFTLELADSSDEENFLDYKKELKAVGIEMNIVKTNWEALLEKMDSGQFDAVYMAWNSGQGEPDPYLLWHSDSIKKGGRNFIGYKNMEVDKLIEQARQEFDRPKRIKIMQNLFQKIVDDAPYLFLFSDLNNSYVVSKRIKRTADSSKYELGISTWKVQ